MMIKVQFEETAECLVQFLILKRKVISFQGLY